MSLKRLLTIKPAHMH
uniref:Uncharacterized protein n=1 Tax=Anguilla anguilla TaxID=7936 RepID=A0A0E9UDJ2_ANGAN